MDGQSRSELVALIERLVRSAKGLVQEATEEHLQLLIDAPLDEFRHGFLQQGVTKTDEQINAVKRFCATELERRKHLEG